jgi:hypothetical protein
MSMPATVPDFFTLPEAGRILRISRNSAYKAATEFEETGGESGLPIVKVGKLKRVPRLALEKLHGGPITWPLADEAVDSVVSPADAGDRLDSQDPATCGGELIQDAEGLETIDRPDQPTLPFEG